MGRRILVPLLWLLLVAVFRPGEERSCEAADAPTAAAAAAAAAASAAAVATLGHRRRRRRGSQEPKAATAAAAAAPDEVLLFRQVKMLNLLVRTVKLQLEVYYCIYIVLYQSCLQV